MKAGDEEKRSLTVCSRADRPRRPIFFCVMNARLGQTSQRRPSWVAPVRRFRRAVGCSLRALEESCRELGESERCREHRPRAAARSLLHAKDSLTRAAGHLGRASVRMGDAMQALAVAPQEGAGAPMAIIEATGRFVEVAGRVAHASNRLKQAMVMVVAAAQSRGLDVPDDLEPVEVARWSLMITRRFSRPWLLQLDLPSLRETIARFLFPRRRRLGPPAALDGVRRIGRGRAPPLSSICTL
jgi:hypothetical protein